MFHLFQNPNNQFKFYEAAPNDYVKIDSDGIIRVNGDLKIPNTPLVVSLYEEINNINNI